MYIAYELAYQEFSINLTKTSNLWFYVFFNHSYIVTDDRYHSQMIMRYVLPHGRLLLKLYFINKW